MTPPIIKRYLIALDQHKLIGLATFALITGISGVVAIQPPPPPSFLAKGLLAYNAPPRVFSDTGQQILEQGRQLTPELLLAENVVDAAAERVQNEPKDIKDNVEIRLPKEGDAPVIEIIYLADDPKIAEITTEVLMQKMVEQSRLVNTERLRAIIDSIEKRLPEAEAELRAAEQQLERYVRVEGPAILAAQDGTLLGGITGSQQQQRQIELTLEGVESQIASLQRQLGLTPDQAYTSSALSADPIIANLRSQILQADTQIELLRNQGYRETHPNVATVLDQKQTYEKLLRERAAEVIGGSGVGQSLSPSRIRVDSSLDPARQQLANRLVELETQRETLVRQLAATQENEQELRQEYQQLPNKQLEQARLQQQVQLKKAFYDQLQTALADANAAETETVTSLSIAQAPQVRTRGEEAGNPVITLGIGAAVGLIAAGGLIFLLSTLDNTFYTPEDIRRALVEREVPLLGELPLVRIIDSERGGETAILIKPDSPYLESYERFRSGLRVENQSMKVVMIVSTVEGEGKTVSAYNLAIASAQAGRRTLLVEADLRSPSNAESLKVTSDPEASVEPLRYYSSKSGCIRLAPDIENLYVVPSPGPQRRAAAVVESSELRQLLEDARGRFDFVVIDTPALSRCNDALLLEPLTDGIVMVTRPGYTQGSILTEAVDELTEAELPLLGAIINGIEQPLPSISSKELGRESEEETEALAEDLDDSIPTGATRF
jgi:capsular exopolysaccharide synthesis family protein